jgi:hypothetical protein
MPLNPKYVLAPNLQTYFVDKETGLPLAGGIVTFYKDNSRSVLKNVYSLEGDPDYTSASYVALDNPMTLSAVGTMVDTSGNDIIPYWYPYDDDGNIELYYITVESADAVPQFTREAWPNTAISSDIVGDSGVKNLISNGQFLAHNDLPLDGKITAVDTEIAQGGWHYIRQTNNAVDFVTYDYRPNMPAEDGTNPEFAINIVRQTGAADSFYGLAIRFPNVKIYSNMAMTLYFQAISTGTAFDVDFYSRAYFGTGGSPSATRYDLEIGSTVTINTGAYPSGGYYVNFTVPDYEGDTVGTNGDDYYELVIQPVNSTYNLHFTDMVLTPGTIPFPASPQSLWPVTPNDIMLSEGVTGYMPTPDPNGFDLYCPLVLTRSGVTFSHDDIGTVFGSYKAAATMNAALLCNGQAFKTKDYSSLGIPYERLQQELVLANTVLANMPLFGTGANFVSGYFITGATPGADFYIETNAPGAVTNSAAGTSGFTVSTPVAGNATVGYEAYAFGGGDDNLFAVSTTVGLTVSASGPHNSGFVVQDILNDANTYAYFEVENIALPADSLKAFYFSNTTTEYQVWMKRNGVGSAPAFAGTTLQVDFLSTDPAYALGAFIQAAIGGRQVSRFTAVAASSITSGMYFTFSTLTQAYYVWFKKDNAGSDPIQTGIAIEVDISTGDTAAVVAQKTINAINAYQFAVPDLQGMFLRGNDPAVQWDIEAPYRFSTTLNYLGGNNLGTAQLDDYLRHVHSYVEKSNTSGIIHTDTNTPQTLFTTPGVATSSTGFSPTERGFQTQPQNTNINWFIKY